MEDLNSKANNPSQGGGYGYGYGYGGYGGGNQNDLQIKKYIEAFRERIWIFVGIFAVVSLAVFVFLKLQQPLYKAQASLQILRQEESSTQFDKVSDDAIRSVEDINTQVKILESVRVIEGVGQRVRTEMKEAFLAPYREEDQEEDELSVEAILFENRKIIPARLSLLVAIEYVHPKPEIAARVANMFTEEVAVMYGQVRNDSVSRAVEDLREQAEIQRRKVENIEKQLIDFKEENNTISLDQRLDIDQQEMISLSSLQTQKEEIYEQYKAEWDLLQRTKEAGRDIHELPFISNVPRVSQLLATAASSRVEIAQLTKRYRHLHPVMIQATESLEASEKELADAIAGEVLILQNQLELAKNNLDKAAIRVEIKKDEIMNLQRLESLYASKQRDLEVNQNLYQYFYNRIQETESQNKGGSQKVRVIDNAEIPLEPFKPNNLLNLAIALFAGGGLSIGVVVVLILLDDRVKSIVDVESKMGLPMLGVLSFLRGKFGSAQQIVKSSDEDPQNSESLNSIVATLKLQPESKDSKVVLIASTISNEGKSYVSAAIASAFHRYGEKAILVNCDFRAKGDKLIKEPGMGVEPYITDTNKTLDDVIYTNQELGCDVFATGSFHWQPYQMYGMPRFKEMMDQLRERYDRIIIDTPPTHLFGDAFSLLQFCDGIIYVVGFGRVRLKLATKMAEKMKESGTPVFGTVVNGIKNSQAKLYYPSYYQPAEAYGDYYPGSSKKKASLFKK
ncbi:polysaccharide biosynthesis tyrosine autokinase [Puniceicoccaceae bacterium K14]|nr:polysaccharide biosynthesis tyrosine autokinase [Puniceicoccaceae bacterium K14]